MVLFIGHEQISLLLSVLSDFLLNTLIIQKYERGRLSALEMISETFNITCKVNHGPFDLQLIPCGVGMASSRGGLT